MFGDQQYDPEYTGYKASRDRHQVASIEIGHQMPDQSDERRCADVTEQPVQPEVVIQLRGAKYRPQSIAMRVAQLAIRHHRRHDKRAGEHDTVPPERIAPGCFVRQQALCRHQQHHNRYGQEEISWHKRHELLGRSHRQQPTLADHTEDKHHAWRNRQTDKRRR